LHSAGELRPVAGEYFRLVRSHRGGLILAGARRHSLWQSAAAIHAASGHCPSQVHEQPTILTHTVVAHGLRSFLVRQSNTTQSAREDQSCAQFSESLSHCSSVSEPRAPGLTTSAARSRAWTRASGLSSSKMAPRSG